MQQSLSKLIAAEGWCSPLTLGFVLAGSAPPAHIALTYAHAVRMSASPQVVAHSVSPTWTTSLTRRHQPEAVEQPAVWACLENSLAAVTGQKHLDVEHGHAWRTP